MGHVYFQLYIFVCLFIFCCLFKQVKPSKIDHVTHGAESLGKTSFHPRKIPKNDFHVVKKTCEKLSC